jgi:hypothetical protein
MFSSSPVKFIEVQRVININDDAPQRIILNVDCIESISAKNTDGTVCSVHLKDGKYMLLVCDYAILKRFLTPLPFAG